MLTRTLRGVVVVALLGALMASATAGQGQGPPDRFAAAIAAQERNTERLLGVPGVVGTGVGLGANGEPAVVIFTRAAGIAALPARLDGVPVVVRVTGEFAALHHRPDHEQGGGKPEPPDPPPSDGAVDIGVSTGNEGECSAGTIGARVKNGANVYALSNNHVYALENQAPIESGVLSPGLYDTGCVYDSSNVIGTLAHYEPLDFGGTNTVDAAIALSSTTELGNSTPTDGYGTPKSTIVAADVGMEAQKYGRTTSLTKGTITAINVTVNVGYGSGTALFVEQIIFEGTKPVIKAGDSGSLLVTDPGSNPVGLLFAGNQSGKLAVANPIDAVLAAFGVTVDGA